MDPLDLLDELARLGATLTVVEGRLLVDGPAGAVTDDLANHIRANRALVFAAVLGRRSGHVLAPCTICRQVSAVHIDSDTWPTCRLTPGCNGRHEPRTRDLASVAPNKRPKQAPLPDRPDRRRLLGPQIPYPTDTQQGEQP